MTDVHSIYGVTFSDTVAKHVGGIMSSQLPIANDVRAEPTDDSPYTFIAALAGQRPGASWTSKALGDLLAALPLTGYDHGSDAGLILYAQKRAQGGTRAPGAAHRSYTFVHGVSVLRTLACDHQQDAVLQADALVSWDGTNDPIQIGTGVTLPAIDDHQQRFTLGPVTVGGQTIDKVRTVNIDFGIQVDVVGADSDIWPSHASISQIVPTITLRGLKHEWFGGDVPLLGLAGVQANTSVAFRKRAVGGTYVDDANAEHVKITMNGIATIDDAGDGQTNAPGEVSLIITSYADTSSGVPMVIDPAAALS